jgi:organic radical activating enzyme
MLFNNNQILSIKALSPNQAQIDWELGNHCNFKCSYCFDGSNSGTHRVPKLNDTIKNNILHLVDQLRAQGKDQFFFNFSGGEPTIYSDIENLVDFLNTIGPVYVTTNASRTLTWWQNNYAKFSRILISYHTEFSDYEHIIRLIDMALGRVKLSLHVMLYQKRFDQAVEVYKDLYRRYDNKPINVELKYVRDNNLHAVYSQEQLAVLDSLLPKPDNSGEYFTTATHLSEVKTSVETQILYPVLIKNLRGNFHGYKCYAHHEYIQVRYTGGVGLLSCGQFYTDKLHNIYSDDFVKNFRIGSTPLTCEINNNCGCYGILMATKHI